MNTIAAHPYLAALFAALLANVFVGGVAYGMTGRFDRDRLAIVGWCRRTFTSAGDDTPPYLDPADRPVLDEQRERQRLHALTEIRLSTLDNLVHLDQHRRAAKAFSRIRRTTGAVN